MVGSAPAMAAASAVAGYSAACLNPLLVIFIADTFPASMRASVVGPGVPHVPRTRHCFSIDDGIIAVFH